MTASVALTSITFFRLCLLGLVILFQASCNYKIQKVPSTDEILKPESAALSFDAVYKAVIEPRCIECHSNAHGNKGKVNLETYAQVLAQLKDVKLSIEDGSMPKDRSPLTADEKSIILYWISIGAPEFENSEPTPLPSPTPEPTEPVEPITVLDFKTVFNAVIDPACLKCHSNPENDGDVNLETYQEVFKHRVMIEKTVRDGSMPKKKALSKQSRELLLQWLQAGASEEARPVRPVESEIQEFDPLDPANLAQNPRTQTEIDKLSRGQYIYRAGLCANCHTADAKKPLAGGVKIRSPFGTFYAPNISQDRKTGIGRWTKADFKKSMRHGISPKGEYYYPSFPFQNYSKITDEDLDDLFFYLQAMPTVVKKNRSHKLGFPYNQRALLGFWRVLNFTKPFQINEANFQLAEGEFRNLTGRSASWNRGAYLVEGALHCTQCHTPRDSLGSLKMDQWMAGARLPGEKAAAGNLTPHKRTGLGAWSEADWITFLDTATTPDGTNMGGKMRSIVTQTTAKLTIEDKKAIAEYFQSLKPVRNQGF